MKKKLRILLIILSSGYLLYFLGTIIWSLSGTITKRPPRDFSYVEKKISITDTDSLYFSRNLISNLSVDYTCEYTDGRYLTSFIYLNKYKFIVRKLNNKPVNLLMNYKPIFEKNTTDLRIKYDIEEVLPFIYKVDVERNNFDNKNTIIDGEHVEVLKNTEDTLLIHGKIYDISIGTHNNYVNEGLYLQDETFYRRPIEMELLIFNRKDGLFCHILFPLTHTTVPNGLIEKLK